MKIEPDIRSFRNALDWIAKLQEKTKREVVLDQGALFCRDSIALTPPFGKIPLKEAKGDQRKVGEKAVIRDIQRAVRGMDKMWEMRKPGVDKAFKRMARTHNTLAAEQFLKDVGFKRVAGVVEAATEELHNSLRSPRGKVHRGMAQFFTWKAVSVERLKRLKLRAVGRAKAGWLVALAGIDALRGKSTYKPAAWVARHSGEPGSFSQMGTDDVFGIICANQIPYAQKHKDRIEREGWKARMIAAPRYARNIYKAMERKARQQQKV